MANEIQCEPAPYLTGVASSLYVILRDSEGQAFDYNDDFALETYATANRSDYAIPVTEQGTASGVYKATMPAIEQQAPDPPLPAIPAGLYTARLYRRLGGSPAEGDLLLYEQQIPWDGTAVVVPGTLLDDAVSADALSDDAAAKIADHWGMSIIANGVSRDDLLQGYQTKKVFNAAGTVLTIYSVDDTTVVQVCNAERFPLTIGGLKSLEGQ